MMDVRRDTKTYISLRFCFLSFKKLRERERVKRCNVHGMGNTKTYTSRILRFLNFEELKEIVGGWRARVRASNEEWNGGGEAREDTLFVSSNLKSRVKGGVETKRTFLSFFDS